MHRLLPRRHGEPSACRREAWYRVSDARTAEGKARDGERAELSCGLVDPVGWGLVYTMGWGLVHSMGEGLNGCSG